MFDLVILYTNIDQKLVNSLHYYTFISPIDWRAFLNTFTNMYKTNLWLNTNKYKHSQYTW